MHARTGLELNWTQTIASCFAIMKPVMVWQLCHHWHRHVAYNLTKFCRATSASDEDDHDYYSDVIMCTIASQITSLTIVYSTVYSDADQRKHQSSASLAFVWGIHRGPVNSPHKWPVTWKMFPFDDVIMISRLWDAAHCMTACYGSSIRSLSPSPRVNSRTWYHVTSDKANSSPHKSIIARNIKHTGVRDNTNDPSEI